MAIALPPPQDLGGFQNLRGLKGKAIRDIAIKGLIRTKPVVEPARSAGSTTGYGFYLLNPCYISQIK